MLCRLILHVSSITRREEGRNMCITIVTNISCHFLGSVCKITDRRKKSFFFAPINRIAQFGRSMGDTRGRIWDRSRLPMPLRPAWHPALQLDHVRSTEDKISRRARSVQNVVFFPHILEFRRSSMIDKNHTENGERNRIS